MRAKGRARVCEATSVAQLLAATTDGGLAIDARGRIVLWNRTAERLLGYTAREAIGRSCCDLLVDHDGGRPHCWGCRAIHLAGGRGFLLNFDARQRTRTGSTIWMGVRTLMVPGNGSGAMAVHLVRDVTSTRELLNLIRERLSGPGSHLVEAPAVAALTRRELEILRLIATGLNTKDAARRLHVSPATVRNHVQNILGKLGAHSRLEAVAYATRYQLI